MYPRHHRMNSYHARALFWDRSNRGRTFRVTQHTGAQQPYLDSMSLISAYPGPCSPAAAYVATGSLQHIHGNIILVRETHTWRTAAPAHDAGLATRLSPVARMFIHSSLCSVITRPYSDAGFTVWRPGCRYSTVAERKMLEWLLEYPGRSG